MWNAESHADLIQRSVQKSIEHGGKPVEIDLDDLTDVDAAEAIKKALPGWAIDWSESSRHRGQPDYIDAWGWNQDGDFATQWRLTARVTTDTDDQ